MKLSKQEVINKIVSFSYEELTLWIKSRLKGDDKYFPIYEGYEPNQGDFLADAFKHIKNKTFRENFLEILNDLTVELWRFTKDKEEIEKNKNYIHELLLLCGTIKNFSNKGALYRIARSGKLKGIIAHDLELHQMLLTTLASYHVSGDYHFWLKQMEDDSNKYYANASFYALINRNYDLDIVFKQIGTFIDRFKGEISLVWGLRALINKYGIEIIFARFQSIESKLSVKQKDAVNVALKKSGYNAVFEMEEPTVKEYQYIPRASLLQFIRAPKPEYEAFLPLNVTAAEIFKFMGFDIQLDHKIADQSIDIFAKRRKSFSPAYQYWICSCMTDKKVSQDAFYHFDLIAKEVKKELEKPGYACDDCQVMIISEKGFIKKVLNAARAHHIILKTYDELLSDLKAFYSRQKPLIEELDTLFAFPP